MGVAKIHQDISWTGEKTEIFEQIEKDGRIRHISKMSISSKDAAVLMNEAKFKSLNGGGMARNSRQMGLIPVAAFIGLRKMAQEEGRALERKDFDKFFSENPGLRIKKVK